ncbi:hypothetical protein C6Q18_17305 [Pseudomonas chlororaphis subsp. piscium]|nr:hypothetical protein C6Q18_17305 [Pseudomonas chlororaphis subsp. piscium]
MRTDARVAWKPPSLFFAAPVRSASIASAANARAAQGSKSAAAYLRIHGAGNDGYNIALGLGTQVDDDKDSDKDSNGAALS